MPEATVLYSVTAAVIAGLLVWVAAVLKTAKEPWARPRALPLKAELEDDAASSATTTESESVARTDSADEEASTKDSAEKLAEATNRSNDLDADDTARATPMALSEGRAKAATPKEPDESKTDDDSPADDAKKAEA